MVEWLLNFNNENILLYAAILFEKIWKCRNEKLILARQPDLNGLLLQVSTSFCELTNSLKISRSAKAPDSSAFQFPVNSYFVTVDASFVNRELGIAANLYSKPGEVLDTATA